jgi:ABC-type glycerol-3-phosphate transport system substrate-binding protein
MRHAIVLALSLAAAAVLAGCGVANPYQTSDAAIVKTTVKTPVKTTRTTTGERATRADSTRAVLRQYTRLSINWTSTTLASEQRQLARLAVGGARAQALQTAASYNSGSTLQRSHIADRGRITSIAPGEGPRAGQWVITTQETTTGQGDYRGLPAQAHIYIARLTHTTDGWAVSSWAPQS